MSNATDIPLEALLAGLEAAGIVPKTTGNAVSEYITVGLLGLLVLERVGAWVVTLIHNPQAALQALEKQIETPSAVTKE